MFLFIAHKNQRPRPPPLTWGDGGSQVHTLPSPQQPGPGKSCPDSPPPGGGTPGDARAIDGELSVDGIYHTRSSSTEPVNLSPRPPRRRGWRSAGVETHRLKHEWGPSPMNHACPGAPQANPTQPSPLFLPRPLPHSLWRRAASAVGIPE